MKVTIVDGDGKKHEGDSKAGTADLNDILTFDLAPGATLVITLSGTLSSQVFTGQSIANTAHVEFTSLDGNVIYFDSADCKRLYEENPEQYSAH